MSSDRRRQDIRQQSAGNATRDHTGEFAEALPIIVLFTTISGTLDALRKAALLADQLGARIQVLAAHVVPYPLPPHKPRVSLEFRFRQFCAACQQEAIETQLDIRLCRDARQCIRDAFTRPSLILIGGCEGWWPFQFEKRLAKDLRNAGHHVVFVGGLPLP